MKQKAGLEYLIKAKSNLNSSKILYENGEKINAVYFLQQTVELLSKSFLMYMGAGEKQLKKWMGHDCIVLHKMLESYNKKLMNQKLMPPKEHLEYSKYLHQNAIQDILKEMDSEYLIDGRKNDDYQLMITEYSKKAELLEIKFMIKKNRELHTKSDKILLPKPNIKSSLVNFSSRSLFNYSGLLNDILVDLMNLTVMFPDGAINEIRYTNDTKKVKKYLSNYKEIYNILDNGIYTLEILINDYQDINSLNNHSH
ncbi:hypothetical protein MMKA1_08180 [Methanococcus maripaludis KA1]|uniref:HEPN domain-containing protein n=2 Tax=Methanococcus maripaludis TaxID=39152 RepID=A0A2Z5PHS9_METMI|nr:hypothetical protein [Methanococcus maripaludis]BAP60935.1 hypothetical protein MMKA1_08180 [Methanococcus maripaludis KA1]